MSGLLLTTIPCPVGAGCVHVFLAAFGWLLGMLGRKRLFCGFVGFSGSFSAGGLNVFVAALCRFLRMLCALLAHLTLLRTSLCALLCTRSAVRKYIASHEA
jgi:hypothetical protein